MPDSARNLDSLFEAAVAIDSIEERAAFLDRSCGANHELRQQLEQLLRSDENARSFLNKPPVEMEATIIPDATGDNLAASLKAGLAAAFSEEQSIVIGKAGHSVLQSLGQSINVPRVSLRDSADQGADPIVRPKSAEMPKHDSDSRYRLDGEIARGGMGAILKGRDTDLGRDLAIKVLLDQHKNKPEVVQRFIEEAQIGGQLQHPGIAPIYELGQFADKRPFFAMKLVKGETLSKLLADRKEAAAERGKFIGIFEQICQTMAYAHSRGVIHRDLKPANIMVGAFGEVQVMDWGLAKVLPSGGVADEKTAHDKQQGQSIIQTLRTKVGSDVPGTVGSLGTFGSHTQMGSVMGTPAYMPPEQALGEIDHLDERADVFGLGAILCEILTGKPPYVADDGIMVYRMASRGKLEDCFQRLDACAADAELVALTRHCLELEPQNRPRHAGVLAERVSGYLESVETKLRETERAKFDAQIRTEELRRRQKLAYSAGAAIAVSLLIGLSASLWQMQRATQAEKVAISEAARATAAFDELRATAPAFAEQARALAAKEQYADAIAKLDYAIKLRPDAVEYLVAKGDLLQCQLQLAPAAAIYRDALRVQPGLARAGASVKLCEELLAAQPAADGKLSRESLAKLHVAMQKQQRPAAELLPVARLLGEEKKLLVEYWLARLKDLPLSAERPLKNRLAFGEDGQLALDLSNTKVTDLSPLAGAPLAVLNLSRSEGLTDLSPLRTLPLIGLDISGTSVTDLTPLREMRSLEHLTIARCEVADLTALSSLRLKSLDCSDCPVSDLAPIRKIPLEEIELQGTQVTDLSPLVGMPIKHIGLADIPAWDFSPLARLPLETCHFAGNSITDLAFLRDLPLKALVLSGCAAARNYAVLNEIKSLELLVIPPSYRDLPAEDYAAIGALRYHPKLRQLSAEIVGGIHYTATRSKEIFWQDWDREQPFVGPLRQQGIKFTLSKRADGTYYLGFSHQPLRDLSMLKGAPISALNLDTCPVTDLTPLHGLPLESLGLFADYVTDLSPLRGMPLKALTLYGAYFSDLSPLKDLPLQSLYLNNCTRVIDVAVVGEIATLENLTVPVQAINIEALRKLPKIKKIGFMRTNKGDGEAVSNVEEFWENYAWISKLRAAGIKAKQLQQQEDGGWLVDLSESGISDLSALQGATVYYLHLWNTPVADLTPLRGMNLRGLSLFNTQVTDLSPLQGMLIEDLTLSGTKVADISALRGMKLNTLTLHDCTELTDLSPLAESKDLATITLPPNAANIEFLRAYPNLKRIGFKEDFVKGVGPDKAAVEFWKHYDIGWVRAVRASVIAIKSLKERPDGTWDVDLSESAISDLAILRGAPIRNLHLWNTPVADLTPLRGMALQWLSLFGTKVTDLSPLKGAPIETLTVSGTKVADISVLRGMPLKSLRLHECTELTDLSPLAECKELKDVTLPPDAKNIESLRTLPKLERIGFREDPKNSFRPDKTAAEFWQEYDAKKK